MGRSLSPADRHSSRKDHKEHKKHKDKDRERDRDRDRGRDRDRDRDRKDRDRERDKDRERSKRHHEDRDRERDKRSKRIKRSRSRSESASRSRSRSRSPKRRAATTTAPAAAPGPAAGSPQTSKPTAAPVAVSAAPVQHVDTTGLSAEDAAKKRKEAEAAELDAEVERRRKRVEEWRAKRLAEQNGTAPAMNAEATSPQGPAATANGPQPLEREASPQGEAVTADGEGVMNGAVVAEGEGEEELGEGDQEGDLLTRSRHRARRNYRTRRAGAGEEGWLEDEAGLEDDHDHDNDMQVDDQDQEGGATDLPPLATPAHLKPRRKKEDEDDEDPLDAFMKVNQPSAAKKAAGPASAAKQQAAGVQAAGGGEEDGEEDPLDAFMKGNQAAVKKLEQEETHEPGPMDEDEEDPLDAFMASNVMSKVKAATPGPVSDDMEHELPQPQVKEEPGTAPSVSASLWAMSDSKAGYAEGSEAQSESSLKAEPGREGSVGPMASTSTAATSKGGSKMVVLQPKPLLSVALTGKPGLGVVRRPGVGAKPRRARMYSSSESESDLSDEEEASEEEDDVAWAQRVNAGKLSKGDKLGTVDHAQIQYPPFRKAFYIEVPELAKMNEKEVTALRKELDGIKVRGNNVPKPIRAWTQAGLSTKVIDLLKKSGCMAPLPIQAQALPIIMSGRDCIGIAKTGSGKTLAYVLPLLRHAKDQPPLQQGDGPIGLIMAPTRELVQQISKETKKYGKLLGLECTAVFGGTGISNQISELKRGSEVVCCTPGRMIDLLVTSNGKITNLRRVTYLVLDEADRMFDMGFEPQIMRIINNVRPDRQTVLFSATFPRSVETLARKVLDNPCEIQVGGRSVVNSDITQIVEIRPEADRYLRLLEIMGEWYERGKIIIFVQSQEKCDTLFRDLLKSAYPCLSLHGGKDQGDRESTIADFKGAVCSVLVATSVAARGLDVPQLVLVVNYDCPNHHEDYVHRVGRTGRAGQKGTAITFIAPEEEKYAPDLVKAFKESNAPIPQDLQDLADSFLAKRKAGLVTGHGSGFGGSGFKFDAEEQDRVKASRKQAAKDYGVEVGDASESDEDDIRVAAGAVGAGGQGDNAAAAAAAAASAAAVEAQARQGGPSQGPSIAGPATASNPQIQDAINQAISRMSGQQPAAPAAQPSVVPSSVNANLQAIMARIQASAPPGTTITLQPPSQPPTTVQPTPALPGFPGMAAPAAQPPVSAAVLAAQQAAAAIAASRGAGAGSSAPGGQSMNTMVAAALAAIPGVQLAGAAAPPPPPVPLPPPLPMISSATNPEAARGAAAKAAQLASLFATRTGAQQAGVAGAPGGAAGLPGPPEMHYEAELEINDFPQHSRWKVTHRDTVNMIAETTGAAVITKGVFVPPGQRAPEGERKIYLLIEGPTEKSVKQAKQELKRILEETTEKVMRRDAPAGMGGKYSVM